MRQVGVQEVGSSSRGWSILQPAMLFSLSADPYWFITTLFFFVVGVVGVVIGSDGDEAAADGADEGGRTRDFLRFRATVLYALY